MGHLAQSHPGAYALILLPITLLVALSGGRGKEARAYFSVQGLLLSRTLCEVKPLSQSTGRQGSWAQGKSLKLFSTGFLGPKPLTVTKYCRDGLISSITVVAF